MSVAPSTAIRAMRTGSRTAPTGWSPRITGTCSTPPTGTHRAERHYRGAITGVLSDIAGAALKFVIGATTLANPGGTALVIFVGGLAVAMAKDGDLAAGAKIVGGTLWLAGPFVTMYALAAEGIAAIGLDSRDVRRDEYALAQLVFGPATPSRDSLRITDTIGAGNRPFPRFDGVITLNLGPEGHADALTIRKGSTATAASATASSARRSSTKWCTPGS